MMKLIPLAFLLAEACSIGGCESPVKARRWCSLHYQRWAKHGDPLTTTSRQFPPVEERFWSKVDKSGECWEWSAACNADGYGSFGSGRHSSVGAHRFSWELHFGPIPNGLFVCHTCDNRRCVRPDHLWLGTNADNIRDAVRKGRVAPPPAVRGEASRLSKLTEQQVVEVRERHARGETFGALSRAFGTTSKTIRFIVTRRTWAHVS